VCLGASGLGGVNHLAGGGNSTTMADKQKSGGGSVSWDVTLEDGKHALKFSHNSITGNRIVSFDGRELYKSGWMFQLVGTVKFKFDHLGKKHTGSIKIKAIGLVYEYELTVDSKTLSRLQDNAKVISRNWKFIAGDGQEHLVVLEKDVMDVWVDGEVVESKGEFVDDGTETIFQVAGKEAYIHTVQSGSTLKQILYVDEVEYPESRETRK